MTWTSALRRGRAQPERPLARHPGATREAGGGRRRLDEHVEMAMQRPGERLHAKRRLHGSGRAPPRRGPRWASSPGSRRPRHATSAPAGAAAAARLLGDDRERRQGAGGDESQAPSPSVPRLGPLGDDARVGGVADARRGPANELAPCGGWLSTSATAAPGSAIASREAREARRRRRGRRSPSRGGRALELEGDERIGEMLGDHPARIADRRRGERIVDHPRRDRRRAARSGAG